MNSKLGVGLALAFVGVIALAFAAGDVSNYRSGSSGGDRDVFLANIQKNLPPE